MARFQKGNPGRPKGAKNKAGQVIRERIDQLFNEAFTVDEIRADIASLEPKERLKVMTDLMPYLLPKLQSTTYREEVDLQGLTDEELDKLVNRIIAAE